MNWPHIIIGAGISAWLHGLAAALFHSLGMQGFTYFGAGICIASAAVFLGGLVAKAVADGEANHERQALSYNERYERRYEAFRSLVEHIGADLKALEKRVEALKDKEPCP